MILLKPKRRDRFYRDAESGEIMHKTIEFFEQEGKDRFKEDDYKRTWYRNFSKSSIQRYGKPSATSQQMQIFLRVIEKPATDPGRFEKVWREHLYTLNGAYSMSV
jgi:hypothetical protein